MRFALLALLLLPACAGRKNQGSLALQGAISDQSGPSGGPTCPWETIEAVRLERETVWIDDVPWPVTSDGAVQRLEQTLALCGETDAIRPLSTWRKAEKDAHEKREQGAKDGAAQIGATVLAGAVTGAASSAGMAQTPDNSQLAHAIRDKNLEPIPSTGAAPVDAELQQVRQALIDALVD